MSRGCDFEKSSFSVVVSDHGKVMPGTCEACVFGADEPHAEGCDAHMLEKGLRVEVIR